MIMHRKKACQMAFRLLVSKENENLITFHRFESVARILKPRSSRINCYLMFKCLDRDKTGLLSQCDFYNVYNVLNLQWKQITPEYHWYYRFVSTNVAKGLDLMRNIVAGKYVEFIVYSMIATTFLWLIIEAILLKSNAQVDNFIEIFTLVVYSTELFLKVFLFGYKDFMRDMWNRFDTFTTLSSLICYFIITNDHRLKVIFALRGFRVLKLYDKKLRKNSAIDTQTLIQIAKQLRRFALLIFVILYSFALLGIELFSTIDTNTSNAKLDITNFSNMVYSFVTLSLMLFGKIWYSAMDNYVSVTSEWSRLYFIAFCLMLIIVTSIIVACIVETVVFKLEYTEKHGNEVNGIQLFNNFSNLTFLKRNFTLIHISTDVYNVLVNWEELRKLGLENEVMQNSEENFYFSFQGRKLRNKFDFSLEMFAEEVKQWVDEMDTERNINNNSLRSRCYTSIV
ncbi:two pore calcium channel protein 1-like isoform X1 [Leptotrombidium deliense]|uniref:Two pore calcium channel protein 1-like isoform X1 n=1 Tax=Leptotrombidium deliense TaxID=299467 RepID=A0A443S1I3_9ACAR|nr:two pore calcium channel protein 1-like isoform X1 [Leptotrombidium deliense]